MHGTYHDHGQAASTEAPLPSAPVAPEPTPQRKHSVDAETAEKLRKGLETRWDKDKLVERGILKGGNVAPALQAAREELQREQLKDKLDHALQVRPKPEELVREGILNDKDAPPA